MRIVTPFDPIECGEIDNFVFDFTADIGAAAITSTSWTCSLPGNSESGGAFDPAPASRILATSVQTSIAVRSSIDGTLGQRLGAFSVASVGGFPRTAAGGNYVLEATSRLNDGRVLKLNSTVQAVRPGQG